MSLVSGFANQRAALEVRTGKDGFGKPVYSSAQIIKVRREPAQGVSRSAVGTDVDVESYYLTEATITTQDRLDGYPVRRVREIVSKGGVRLGCEAWV